jgi:hypothetical protein
MADGGEPDDLPLADQAKLECASKTVRRRSPSVHAVASSLCARYTHQPRVKIVLLVLGLSCYGQNPSASKCIWTKIEATELDRRMLLELQYTHDQDHCMRFELAESDYDCRIVFSAGQVTTQFHVRIP